VELTNEDIKNSTAYKEYYAIASGAAPSKTKESTRKTQCSSDTKIPPPTASSTRLLTSAKGKQPAKSSKAKGLSVLTEVAMTEAEQMKLATKRSLDEDDNEVDDISDDQEDDDDQDDDDQDDNDDDQDTDNDDDDFVHPKLSIREEAKDKESFDPIIQTPENSDDKGNDDASLGMNVGGEEGQDDNEELYRDVNINLEELFHFVTSMLNLSPDAGIDSLFESTPRVDVQASTTVASLTLFAPTLIPPTIPIIFQEILLKLNLPDQRLILTDSQVTSTKNGRMTKPCLPHRFIANCFSGGHLKMEVKFAGAVTSIPGIVERYMDQRMNEAVKTSYVMPADLSEMKLKKILIEKMERNKSIHRSDEQRNLYKALVDAYECDKIILYTYGDTVTLKRRRDDADKDEEVTAGSNRGPNRRREGKEPETTSAPKEKATKTTGNRKYTTSVTKTKAADYGHIKWIEDLHLDWITVRRDDDKLYKFKEGNFKRLHIQDIKDMLLLLVQGNMKNLTVEERFAFNISLRMFTRSIVIQWRVEDLQLGIKSYQKKLNLTKPDTRSDKERAAAMIQAIDKQLKMRRIMRSLEKFVAGNPVKEILLKLNLPDHRSILTDSQVTPTKHGRMAKPYSSHRFIANCFNAGHLKMEVKERMIEEIDQDDEIALDADTQGRKNDNKMFGVNDLSGEEVVTTVVDKVSASPTTNVTKDEITMAQALAALKSIKPIILDDDTKVTTVVLTPRAKGIVFHKQKQSHIPTVSLSKDKGKAKMIEPEVPIKKKDQMRMDKEYAKQLEAEEQKAVRLSRAQQDEEANISWDNIQAMIEADSLLAERLQAREKEEFSKKQKVDENVDPDIDDTKELKKCMEIVLDDGDEMFKNFNREYVEVLWAIVKDKFKKEKPVDDMDNLMFRTLKTMFEHNVEDTIWTYQQGLAKVKNWKLFESCRVYCITMQSIIYYLLVEKENLSPTIYTTCIKQFWTSAKVKTVINDVWIQALVDGKKVVVNEASIRRNLRLDDAEGTACLPNVAIFEELVRMGTMASAIICLANNQKFNFSKYIFESMVKNLDVGVKFLMYPRYLQVFINNQLGDMSHHKEIFVNPSLTKKKKHKSRRKHKKETKVSQDGTPTKEHIPTPSYDPLPSGEDRLQPSELMEICTKLSNRVLSLEQTKTNQAAEIKKLKKRVKKLEGKKKKRTHGLKRLYKGRMNEEDLFRIHDLSGDEMFVDVTASENVEHDATVAEKEISTGDLVTTTDVLTLAQTLMEIKAAKPKEKRVTIQEPSEFRTISSSRPSQPPQAKDKGKGIMVEPEKPLKMKDQIVLNEEVVRKLEAEIKDKMEEEERIAREKEETNIAMIAEWDNTQAMMDADCELAGKLQEEEKGELTIKEKSKLFVELMNKRKKHFKRLRAEERRRKPPTKA
nr:hypothetical protein [Tanacetum cinerariifolium]